MRNMLVNKESKESVLNLFEKNIECKIERSRNQTGRLGCKRFKT